MRDMSGSAKEGTAVADRENEITACTPLPRGAVHSMKEPEPPKTTDRETQERQRTRDLRRALGFGIVMASMQMGILLYFMYC
jgi:hypothetical protein